MSVANKGAHGTLSKSVSLIGSATAASVSSIDITPSQAYSRSNHDVWMVIWFLEHSSSPASGATASGNGLTWEFIADAAWTPATGNFRIGRAAGAATANQSIGTVTLALTGTNDYVWAGLFEVHGGTAMKTGLWPTASAWPYWVWGSSVLGTNNNETFTGFNHFAQYSTTAFGNWDNSAQAFFCWKTNTEPVTATTSAFEPTPNTWYGLTADPGGQITMPSGSVSLDIVNREGIAHNNWHGVRWDWTTSAAYADLNLRWIDRTNYSDDFETTEWDGGSITPTGAFTATFLAYLELLSNAVGAAGALTADLLTTILQSVSGAITLTSSRLKDIAKSFTGTVSPTNSDGSSPSTVFRWTAKPISPGGTISPLGVLYDEIVPLLLSVTQSATLTLTAIAEGAKTLTATALGALGLTSNSEDTASLTATEEDTTISLTRKDERSQ